MPYIIEEVIVLVLSVNKLIEAILERRSIIRVHRDQRMDDRCWLDDYPVWLMLNDTPEEPAKLPVHEEMMNLCKNFYVFRREPKADKIPPRAIRDRRLWDKDLYAPTLIRTNLIKELFKIQVSIKNHRDISYRHRTTEDDRMLYSILPEKMPADFRLPPRKDFLEDGKAPIAGCPAFHKSHDSCPKDIPCNTHAWGPCT
ncbi:MAG: hypothetical protein Q7S19_01145 [bacterium]|nr:hypothetical protein [bacterium]